MRDIRVLTNTGKGRECLVIGGGPSLGEFDFSAVREDTVRMVINDTVHLPEDFRIDYNVCRCSKYKPRLLNRINLLKAQGVEIMCHSSHQVNMGDYVFDQNSFNNHAFLHGGGAALYIASVLMSFDRVYIIGFDYYRVGKAVHCYGEDGDATSDHYTDDHDREMFAKALFKNGLKDFDRLKTWPDNIVNLNPESKLIKFPFGAMYADQMQETPA